MKYSPDAYLLHEAGRFVTFNIRIKVVMKDPIDPAILTPAAEAAFRRYPYLAKQISIDEEGGIDLVPNPRPISVRAVTKKRHYLFSEASNYLPCSVEYEGSCLFFNMYHGMCGGCGTSAWMKTTVYEYICARYGVRPDPGTTLLADTPVSPEEYAFPRLEDLPATPPLGSFKRDKVWFPGLEYLLGFGRLLFRDSIHYELEIPKQAMLRFAGANDGSPMAVMTAVLFKALSRALPKNKLPFRGQSNHNCRAEVGCPRSHRDLLIPLYYFFPHHAKDWPLDKICTVIRSTTYLQSQPEFAFDALRRFYAFTDGVDGVKGLKEKSRYAIKNSVRVSDLHSTFNINYSGREDWGGMVEYVDSVYAITDAHLLLEILDLNENFCLSLMQMNKSPKYIRRICEVLEEEGIPYTLHGIRENHLPISNVKSAPL